VNVVHVGRLLGWLFWAGLVNRSLCELFKNCSNAFGLI
jgi:hypothetical protein